MQTPEPLREQSRYEVLFSYLRVRPLPKVLLRHAVPMQALVRRRAMGYASMDPPARIGKIYTSILSPPLQPTVPAAQLLNTSSRFPAKSPTIFSTEWSRLWLSCQ